MPLPIGSTYGQLTILSFEKGCAKENKRVTYNCQCSCGNIISKNDKGLVRQKNPHCGCLLDTITKVCAECKVDKPKSEYHKLATKNCGVQSKCKACTFTYKKKRYWDNRETELPKYAKSRSKPENRAQRKRYSELNKDKAQQRYYSTIADPVKKAKRKEIAKRSIAKNRVESNRRVVEIHHKRKLVDMGYVMKKRLRSRLRHIIRDLGGSKFKYLSAISLLGCDMEFFKSHFESTFKDGMCWERISEIDADHIKPCAKFDLTKIEDQKACFHYSNIQALWRMDNIKKGSKYIPIPIKH